MPKHFLSHLLSSQPLDYSFEDLLVQPKKDKDEEEQKIEFLPQTSRPGTRSNLTIDLYETPEEIVVKGWLPGVRPEDIEINLKEKFLQIKAERKRENEMSVKDYYFKESEHGELERSIRLHKAVDVQKAEASFEHGVLTVLLPKLIVHEN